MERKARIIYELLRELDEGADARFGWHPRVEGATDDEVRQHLLLAKREQLVDFELVRAFRGRWTTDSPRILRRGIDTLNAMRSGKMRIA